MEKKKIIKLLLGYTIALLGMTLVLSIDGSTNYTKPMHVLMVECNTSTGALSDTTKKYTITFKDDLNGRMWEIESNNLYKVGDKYNITINDNATVQTILDDKIIAVQKYNYNN